MSEKNISFKIYRGIHSIDEIAHLVDFRLSVFTGEQGFPADKDVDGNDLEAVHFEMSYNNQFAGNARYYRKDDYLVISRVAIKKEFRGLGLGKVLVAKVIEDASQTQYEFARIRVMDDLIPFYEKFGGKITGESYFDQGVFFTPMEIPLRG